MEEVELRFLLDDENHSSRGVNRDLEAFEGGAAHKAESRIMTNDTPIENQNIPQEQLRIGDRRVKGLLENETNIF